MLDFPNAWQLLGNGQRFPVAYLETAELFRRLDLNPDDLAWQPLVSNPPRQQLAEGIAPCLPAPVSAETKRKLADSLGIASEKIEITIRL